MTPTPIFLEELGRENFPFKHLVENNVAIKKALFAEFLKTDLKPNHTLYRRKYFTDKEHEKNMSVIGNFETPYEKKLKKMNLEIYSLQCEEREKYYSHDLTKTPTVIALKSIAENINTARKEEKAFLSIHAEKIKSTISSLQSFELRNALLNLLSNNNEPLWLSFWLKPNEANDLKEKEILFKAYFKLKEKPQQRNITLEDFFTDEVSQELIMAIQEKFKDLRGKEMAILIYILHKKYSLIYLDNNQRNKKSRIHFVRALTETEIKTIKGINNFFQPITAETTVNEKDEVFVKLDEQLKEIVSNG